MKRVVGLVAALWLAATGNAFATGDFRSGNWVGFAQFTGQGGSFSSCRMEAGYNNGWKMIFVITPDEQVLLGFYNERFDFKPQENTESLRIQVDSSNVVTREFSIIDSKTFGTVITNSDNEFQLLRRGRTFHVEVFNKWESFTLQGTSAALVRLLACVRQYK